MVKLTSIIHTLTTLSLSTYTTAATVKIMPFGASIVGAPGCWRANLWKKLQDASIKNTHFVGSLPAPDCGPTFTGYDGANEGHAGYLATGILSANQLPTWLQKSTPDIILMHLGTNDIIQHKSTTEIIDAYAKLVVQMRESKSSMRILVSQLIPIAPGKFAGADTGIVELNKAIRKWGPTNSTEESPITILDPFTGFNTTTDTTDGEHPNDNGNKKLADAYFAAVVKAVREVGEEGDDKMGVVKGTKRRGQR